MRRIDDWMIVAAIAETGTTALAAEQLGVNQSTVLRRMNQLEEDLDARLFARDQRGCTLTPQCEALLPHIRRLGVVASDLERMATGLDRSLAGEVRLSANGTVVRYLLADALAEFRATYPDIVVHLDITDRLVNVAEREADIVIRGSNQPAPNLFGRRLMRLRFAVYAGEGMDTATLSRKLEEDPASLPWISWGGQLLRTTSAKQLRSQLEGVKPVMTTTHVATGAYLAQANVGCTILPRFLGDRVPGLVRLGEDLPGVNTELWVLTHEDLRRTVRVSALLSFIAAAINQSNEIPSVD